MGMLQPGQHLPNSHSHYRLLEKIGEGGYGLVFLAEDLHQPGLQFAIKFFMKWQDSPELVQSFIDEAMFGCRVRSNHLGHTLALLDLRAHTEEGWPAVALVMEYYDCSLAQVVKDNGAAIRASQIARWTRDLVLGLAELHERYDRVHRDIKPTNIMFHLDENTRYQGAASLDGAEALLTDFGTLGKVNEFSKSAVVCDGWKDPKLYPNSTVSEPAPQRCVPAMDIYSFGLVLREFAKICEGDTKWLEDVATDCTHADPDERPAAADLFLRLAPDWDEQIRLINDAGRRLEEHRDFVGRKFIIDGAFEEFVQTCQGKGGVFVIEGLPGVGKTALLTNWPQKVGQPFGFYYRIRDNRTNPAAMPRSLAQQLGRQFQLEVREPHPQNEKDWTGILERLCADIARKADRPARLLLFIDGLDEADDPSEAVGYLPKSLPAGIFVITSTRPPKGDDHLASLRDSSAKFFDLKADDRKNLDDLAEFLRQQLKEQISSSQAQEFAQNVGGIFLLAKFLVEEIQKKEITVAEALDKTVQWADLEPSERLFAYYEKSWQRICKTKNMDSENLGTFAGLMAAVFNWISEEQIGRILGWYEEKTLHRGSRYWSSFRLREVAKLLTWFLISSEKPNTKNKPEVFFQIRHQSVRDYLVSAKGPVSSYSLEEMHHAIGQYYQNESNRYDWEHVDPYGRFYVVRHLLTTEQKANIEQGVDLLGSLLYLHATLGDEPPKD